MNPVPQDTPVHRATIRELTTEQLDELITSMRERRMRSYNAYEIAKAAKAKIKLEKDKQRYDYLLNQFQKKLETTDKGLDALSKYLNELKVLELVCGD